MNIMFLNLSFIERFDLVNKSIKEDKNLKNILKSDVVIFGFEDEEVNFLTEKYYDVVEKLKDISKQGKTNFIFPFYIKKTFRNYLGAVLIKSGKIKKFFGECFTDKNLIFKVLNKKIAILFYYDLFCKVGKEISNNVNIVIGIDDEDELDNLVFLENEFYNKLIFVGKNLVVKSKILLKNKKEQKIMANIMYKI